MDVSVIIPYYYGNKYLLKLLEVVQRNRIALGNKGMDLEVIIVNDSPDEEIVITDALLSNSVTVLCNPINQGIHQSRVNGLNTARGKYILFVDQDDLITDNCLLSQVNAIGSYDFVVGNGYKTDSKDKYQLFKNAKEQRRCIKLNYYYFYTCPIISPGQVLIKKDSIPVEWKENILKHNGSDDYYLWLLLLEGGAKGTINSESVYVHVYTGTNTSLDANYMRRSTRELVEHLRGKVPNWKLKCILRRTDYFCENRGSVLDRIKYFDVCVLRALFGKLLK